MKKLKIVGMLIISALIASYCLANGKKDESKSGTKESLTIIKPGPKGELRILSKEIAAAKPGKLGKARQEVKPDTSPRKARIVVVPAIYARQVRSKSERLLNEKFGITDAGVIENPSYTSFLTDALVNCRKFDVLERENLSSVTKELDFGESEYADTAKVVKLGRMLNADYVIIPEIQFVEFRPARIIPYIGKAGKRLEARVDISLRTVDVATSRLASSYMYSAKLRKSRKRDESNASLVKGLRAELYRNSAMEGIANVIDVVYPIKVIAKGEDYCILNRGKGAIAKGEILKVYKPGEVLVDPDTRENLGYYEALVGKLKVTKVTAKTAKAEIVEGAGEIQKFFICRREGKAGKIPVPVMKID